MNGQSVNLALIEPFFSGSHKAFAEGYAKASGHRVEIVSLPGRFWKWRMRAAAFEMAKRVDGLKTRPDVIFASSLMDAAHFRAVSVSGKIPFALFFHECQASYPSSGERTPERDYVYVLTDLASAAAADAVVFNSESLRKDFFRETEHFLRRMPDARPFHALEAVYEKSRVLHLGIDFEGFDGRGRERRRPLSVLWPHRWEHDKNPEEFFCVMEKLMDEGADFRLLVAGASYGRKPAVFARARERLAGRIDHWGNAADRVAYIELLKKADIVVSTAFHETFGMAVAEAARAGAHPLVPERLSYPEVVPEEFHEKCLYGPEEGLYGALSALLGGERELINPERLAERFDRFSWSRRAACFDRLATEVLQNGKL